MELSVRPGRNLAMAAHLLPSSVCFWVMVRSCRAQLLRDEGQQNSGLSQVARL